MNQMSLNPKTVFKSQFARAKRIRKAGNKRSDHARLGGMPGARRVVTQKRRGY